MELKLCKGHVYLITDTLLLDRFWIISESLNYYNLATQNTVMKKTTSA